MEYLKLLKERKTMLALLLLSTSMVAGAREIYINQDEPKSLNSLINEIKSSVPLYYEAKTYTVESEEIDYSALEIEKYKENIKFYTDIYNLDYEVVLSIISDLTDDFTNEDFVVNNLISNPTMKSKVVDFNNKDFSFLVEIRNIYFNYNKYGYTFDEVTKKENSGISYSTDELAEKGYEIDYLTIVEKLSYEEQIYNISNVIGVDPALVYAICRHESTFNSYQFNNNNNPSGIRFSYGFAIFPTLYSGFIDTALEMLKYELNGKTSISDIGNVYAPTSDPLNSGWVSGVTKYYNEAKEMYELLYQEEQLVKQ